MLRANEQMLRAMTDEAIEKLAREYAEEQTPSPILQSVLAEDTAHVIRFILRTHCIVSKSEVMEAYKYTTTPTNEFTPSRMRKMVRSTLEALFGSDLFKDNGDE